MTFYFHSYHRNENKLICIRLFWYKEHTIHDTLTNQRVIIIPHLYRGNTYDSSDVWVISITQEVFPNNAAHRSQLIHNFLRMMTHMITPIWFIWLCWTLAQCHCQCYHVKTQIEIYVPGKNYDSTHFKPQREQDSPKLPIYSIVTFHSTNSLGLLWPQNSTKQQMKHPLPLKPVKK